MTDEAAAWADFYDITVDLYDSDARGTGDLLKNMGADEGLINKFVERFVQTADGQRFERDSKR